MARTKIDYGIDLGTTNSAIARMHNGEIKIIKSDHGQSDTTPSCVHFNKKKTMFVGQQGFNQLSNDAVKAFKTFSTTRNSDEDKNTYIEFKRTMGSDKRYECSNMERSYSSEELSAEVLKKLKSYVRDDDDLNAVIITVPAMFQQHQVAATQRAAELAGFQYCELLQEPIAASMAYGLASKKTDGFWLVFDFGGGTFDAALMKAEEGIIKVRDTAGDNHLGGKNIDYAIIDEIFIPYLEEQYEIDEILSDDQGRHLLREALKKTAEELKIEFAQKEKVAVYLDDFGVDDNENELILDLTVSLQQFEDVAMPIIQRAVDISSELVKRNNLKGSDLETIILVGGPTFLQTLRRMLTEQITFKVDISMDPMTSVAVGAALYATTRNVPMNLQTRDRSKVQLTLRYEETTVELKENLGVKVERSRTEGAVPAQLFAEVSRNDKGWSSGKVELEGDAEIIHIQLSAGKTNGFTITIFDSTGTIIPCEPTSISIIQGLKPGNSTLPLNICIEAWDPKEEKNCLIPIPGLEKNKSLPAKGKAIFKTTTDLRAGNKKDYFDVKVFETKSPRSRGFADEWVSTLRITGEHIPQFLPKGSEVELRLEIDSSRRIMCQAYFPSLDDTYEGEMPKKVQEEIDADVLENNIAKAQDELESVGDDVCGDSDVTERLSNELDTLQEQLGAGRGDHDRKTEVSSRLKDIWKEIDALHSAAAWPKREQDLDEWLERIKETQERYGSDETAKILKEIESQAKKVKDTKDVKGAKILSEKLSDLDFIIIREQIGFWVSLFRDMVDEFDEIEWKDKRLARQVIEEGMKILATTPTKAKMESIVRQLYNLKVFAQTIGPGTYGPGMGDLEYS